MKTLATGIIAFTLTVAGAAYAGGNPDENDFGVGTRDPLPQAAPVIPDQYEIQRREEEKFFAKPQIKPEHLKAEPDEETVQIVRAEPESECKHAFDFLADLIGGCYQLNATLGDTDVEPAPDGPQFETRTKTETKMGKFRSKRSAKRFARAKKAKGYDVEIERIRTKYGKRYKVTATKTTSFQVEVERDSGSRDTETSAESNGMQDRDVDTGGRSAERF